MSKLRETVLKPVILQKPRITGGVLKDTGNSKWHRPGLEARFNFVATGAISIAS